MFITFEGIDFCGKSTQVKLLADYLNKNGKSVITIREPGGTKISEKIREILLDKKNDEMFVESELLLFSASRAQLVREIILPKIKDGYFVISDRFHDSSIAYQGFGRGINKEYVTKIQEFAIGDAVPDKTFFIDVTIDEMEKRKHLCSDDSLDRIEISKNNFFEKVREGYKILAEENMRFVVIDGAQSIEEIHRQIIENLFGKK